MLHCRGCGRVYYASASDVASAGDLRCECGLPLRHVVPGRDDHAGGPEPLDLLPQEPFAPADPAPPEPGPDEFGEYDVAGDATPEARPVLAALAPERAGPVIPYRAVAQEVVDPDLYFPHKPTDLYAPVLLLMLGAGIGLAELIHLYGDVWRAASFGTAYLIVKLLMLFMCVPLLTRIFGMSFGTLPSAALKLTAIAILPETVGVGIILLSGGCMGVLIALPVSFIVSWAMFAKLFDLDIFESRLCAAVYWGVGLAFGFGWGALFVWLVSMLK
jgi:hypothetical protein